MKPGQGEQSFPEAIQQVTDPVQTQNTATPAPPAQQVSRMMAPPGTSPRSEQGPVPSEQQELLAAAVPDAPVIPEELHHIIEQGEDVQKETLSLSQQVKEAGVVPIATAVPVPETVHNPLPMTYTEAVTTKKTSKIHDAVKWFATLVVKQWQRMNPTVYN